MNRNSVQSKQVPGNGLSPVPQAHLQATGEARAQLVEGGLLQHFPLGDGSMQEVGNEQRDEADGRNAEAEKTKRRSPMPVGELSKCLLEKRERYTFEGTA